MVYSFEICSMFFFTLETQITWTWHSQEFLVPRTLRTLMYSILWVCFVHDGLGYTIPTTSVLCSCRFSDPKYWYSSFTCSNAVDSHSYSLEVWKNLPSLKHLILERIISRLIANRIARGWVTEIAKSTCNKCLKICSSWKESYAQDCES